MEKLQGPIIHPCLLEEHLEVGCIDQQNGGGLGISTCGQFMSRFEVVDPHYSSLPTLEDKMPFLQMLQGIEPPQPFLPPPPFLQEPNFQLLLRLQQEKINMNMNMNMNMSCFTNNNNDMMLMEDQLRHSPVKSEITTTQQQVSTPPPLSQSSSQRRKAGGRSNIRAAAHLPKSCPDGGGDGGGGAHRERRKRKRAARPRKNKEQVESQRMTHIAVERNRRRQMNEHLNALRSLMPPSYVQRGDQASIIGGAIDFVKELEQLLHSLQAQKRVRQQCEDQNGDVSATSTTSTTTCSSSNFFSNVSSLHFRNNSQLDEVEPGGFAEYAKANHEQELCAENRSSLADIEVVVIQNHVNLKVQCQRRPGQLLKAIVALEDIRLSVLHLNITSLHSLVLYSFNLKIEDDCKLGSANEVASAVHQIFSLIDVT